MLLLPVILFNVVTTLCALNINTTGKKSWTYSSSSTFKSLALVSGVGASFPRDLGIVLGSDDLSPRIWYGERANIIDYPFFAGLIVNNNYQCGAVILSEWWLATAAHCVDIDTLHEYDKDVWVGNNIDSWSKNNQAYTFNEWIIYPHYFYINGEIPVNDIALLKLTRPLTFSNNVKPIKLPKRKYELNAVYAFSGMGLDETGHMSNHLMSINMRTLNTDKCLSYLPWMTRFMLHPFLSLIKPVTICTTRHKNKPGVCYGDSGSPLVHGDILIGIASFIDKSNCAEARLGMYTNVAPFVRWIEEVTGIH